MITIEINADPLRDRLAALAERVGHMRTALQMVGEGILARTDKRFSTETDPDGKRWQELAKATKRRKRGTKILTESGDLRGSIAAQATETALTLTAREPYAAIHQFGGTIQRQAGSVTVRHRTNAAGDLLRGAIMGGRGLVFAKASHKRAVQRSFAHAAYSIRIPARPYLPFKADGTLYPAEQAAILDAIAAWIAGAGGRAENAA